MDIRNSEGEISGVVPAGALVTKQKGTAKVQLNRVLTCYLVRPYGLKHLALLGLLFLAHFGYFLSPQQVSA